MGRFTALASEATPVPSLLSRKKLKDWQKVPKKRPELRFQVGIFFPELCMGGVCEVNRHGCLVLLIENADKFRGFIPRVHARDGAVPYKERPAMSFF